MPQPHVEGDPRDLGPSGYFEWASRAGLNNTAARKWFGEVIGAGRYCADELLVKGAIAKRAAANLSHLPKLELTEHFTSQKDGFQKLLFTTHDNLAIETVLIPLHKEGAVSVCLSSQVGCVMGCAFCATAKMKSRRNLRSWEIVDQFIQARAIASSQGRRITGAVFMGMGEPFLNYTNVINAARSLHFPIGGAISGRAITISTVGLIDEIIRFTEENHPYRLSISLGSAFDHKRAVLVPVAARTPVDVVMKAARVYALARNDRVNLAYVCVGGYNVGEEDAKALGELIGDTPVRLDLIDVTDHSGRFKPPEDTELRAFRDALAKYVKQPVARRYSGGSDIRASCGSLAGEALTA